MKKYFALTGALAILMLTAIETANAAASLEVTPDVVYGHKEGMALTYDVIAPTAKPNGAAVLFMVSGGWVSKWAPPQMARPFVGGLLDSGFTVYLVRHGSSPRFNVPEAVSDVQKAVAHIYKHASDHGVDQKRLGVFGGSAGGHLSLMLGCATGEVGQEPDAAAKAGDGRVAAVVAYFPPVDLQPIVGLEAFTESFPALDFPKDQAAYVSPLLHVSSDDPPTLLIHGDADKLVPISASETMYAALQDAKVKSDFITIKGGGHGFRGDNAKEAEKALIAWFEEHLTK